MPFFKYCIYYYQLICIICTKFKESNIQIIVSVSGQMSLFVNKNGCHNYHCLQQQCFLAYNRDIL